MKKFLIALTLAFICLPSFAWEPTPGKPVTIIIAYSPGSANELLTRKVVSIINKKHNTNFVIELKPGAYELIGMNHFADAASDGYTLYSPGAGAYYGTPVWFKSKVKTDPANWEYVANLGQSPVALFAKTDSKVNNPKDFAKALSTQEKVNVAVGAPVFVLAYEYMAKQAKSSDSQRIQYNGPAPVIQAVVAKDVEFGLAPLSMAVEFAKDNKLKVIGITGNSNHNYPKLSDEFKGLSVIAQVGMVLPQATPKVISDYYKKIFTEATNSQEYKDFLESINWYDSLKTSENYKAWVFDQRKKWMPVAETVEFK